MGKNRRRTSKFFTNALRVGTATVEYHEKTPRKRVDRTGRENEGERDEKGLKRTNSTQGGGGRKGKRKGGGSEKDRRKTREGRVRLARDPTRKNCRKGRPCELGDWPEEKP